MIVEQMQLRGLKAVEADPVVEVSDEPVLPAAAMTGAELRKRVEEGGTIALVLAALALVVGTSLAFQLHDGRRFESRVILLTTIYVITGILMRRRHDIWAAGVAALVATGLFVSNLVFTGSYGSWGYFAIGVGMSIIPLYFLWSAFLSARALRTSRDETVSLPADEVRQPP
ncbi:MAG TPA: hypothetical protein VGO46_15090 [Gemmatimonadaceae bacterium]|nr:hypothetical protein [Gemmatimonadaceae bacterium]